MITSFINFCSFQHASKIFLYPCPCHLRFPRLLDFQTFSSPSKLPPLPIYLALENNKYQNQITEVCLFKKRNAFNKIS